MRDVALPDGPADRVLTRSLAACLAAVTEVPMPQIPDAEADLADAVAAWRGWLAGRGAGMVPIAEPARFNWPGYWIALIGEDVDVVVDTDEQVAVVMFGTPAGVVLSPQDHALLGRAAAELQVRRGFVVAALDPVLPTLAASPRVWGHIEAIAVAERATGPVSLVHTAQALAGRGLEGDRYAKRAGTFTPSSGAGSGYDLTLIEAEALENLSLENGVRLGYADARRNLVTRGIDLNALVGQRFRVGDVECLGQRLCEPCAHLQRLTTKGALRGLIHRGGLRADILTDGPITTGAVIDTTDQP